MIHVIDCGTGNVQSVLNALQRINIVWKCARCVSDLDGVERVILPGVGHYDEAMQRFNKSGMRETLDVLVKNENISVLGICVGMQMMAEGSDEGCIPGLNWIPGRVRAFAGNPKIGSLALPHMGWNDIQSVSNSPLITNYFQESAEFYFLHSYYFDSENRNDVKATAHYGFDFDALVSRGRIHGTQFHPEKSHRWGIELLRNFARS